MRDPSGALANHLRKADVLALGFDDDDEDDEEIYRGDLLQIGDPFRTIEERIFESDIG